MTGIEEIKNTFGIEIALVLLCCRVHFSTETPDALQEYIDHQKIDWQYVQTLACYHRIEPLVFRILGNARIPVAIASQIKQKQHGLIQQSFKNAIETERIMLLLQKHQINCLPYKGVSFSKQFYGDIVSRESSDIDLVISPSDFEQLIPLMRKEGYSFESQTEYEYLKKDFKNYTKEINFNKYENENRIFHVEFHWKISDNRIKLKSEANELLYKKGTPLTLAKNEVHSLDINAHFLVVFIHHAMNDGFSFLRNIVDLSQITKIENTSLNLPFINSALSEYNLKHAALICTYLASELLGVNLPISNSSFETISAKHKTHFIHQLLHKKMIGYHFEIKPVNKSILYLKDNAREKIKYLTGCLQLRFTPSPKDFRTFRLPKYLYFMYGVLKPFRSVFSRVSNEEAKQIAKTQK